MDITFAEGFDGKVGFNFLGFTIKQFKSKYGAAKSTTGQSLGFKTLIYPSKKSIDKHLTRLHDLILVKGKGMPQIALITLLNPMPTKYCFAIFCGQSIRGWAHYFGAFDANTMLRPQNIFNAKH